MMETQYERRIAILERQLSEACATIQGLRLALEEAQKQITELTRLHVCEHGAAAVTAEPAPDRHGLRRGGNRG
jgi:phage shock protein A